MGTGGKSFHPNPRAMTVIVDTQSQYDAALADYRSIPSRSRKLKHAAAERLHAAREALKAAGLA